MHPGPHAAATPDKPAVIMSQSGTTITYAELDERATRLARLWESWGLRPGDHVSILAENHPVYFEVYWAAIRSGLYFTAINRHFSPDEVAHVLTDSEASVLVATESMLDAASRAASIAGRDLRRMSVGGDAPGFVDYDDALSSASNEPLAQMPRGDFMLYSSGTTGTPKGIKRRLTGLTVDEAPGTVVTEIARDQLDMSAASIYLSPAPLYHAAPLGFSATVHELGGTVVVMERFDPAEFLRAVERYGVTHTQVVPTMFVRMLKLDPRVRTAPDIGSLTCVLHAAAPCPPEVKREVIEWLGPIVYEYYSSTEGNGMTFIDSQDWLSHPGSVGRAMIGVPHICDDAGAELPPGEAGLIYFERDTPPFEYHHDESRTADARHPHHENWTTVGDVGYLDADGYLYLTDRKAFTIISGGVNIYPQEVENCLILHPDVADVAVFGLPDPEMGEYVQAVVEVVDGSTPGDELAEELRLYVRDRIAHYKLPRHIDFRDSLPRLQTGKLYKKALREEYLALTNEPS